MINPTTLDELRDGDVVRITGSTNPRWSWRHSGELTVLHDNELNEVGFIGVNGLAWYPSDNTEWEFIRRP